MKGLKEYFENTKGTGILSTADEHGKVNAAIYARPHILESGGASFIMTAKTTYQNIQSNQNAHYLFIEDGKGYSGKRLTLKKIKESKDIEQINALRRKTYSDEVEQNIKNLTLVTFQIEEVRPLTSGELKG